VTSNIHAFRARQIVPTTLAAATLDRLLHHARLQAEGTTGDRWRPICPARRALCQSHPVRDLSAEPLAAATGYAQVMRIPGARTCEARDVAATRAERRVALAARRIAERGPHVILLLDRQIGAGQFHA